MELKGMGPSGGGEYVGAYVMAVFWMVLKKVFENGMVSGREDIR
jgi:hypothetical protein